MNAGAKAIAEGVNVDFIFNELINHSHDITSKYILMTYYNIISSYGETILDKCVEAGVFGLIIPDLPFELIEKFKKIFQIIKLKLFL